MNENSQFCSVQDMNTELEALKAEVAELRTSKQQVQHSLAGEKERRQQVEVELTAAEKRRQTVEEDLRKAKTMSRESAEVSCCTTKPCLVVLCILCMSARCAYGRSSGGELVSEVASRIELLIYLG